MYIDPGLLVVNQPDHRLVSCDVELAGVGTKTHDTGGLWFVDEDIIRTPKALRRRNLSDARSAECLYT